MAENLEKQEDVRRQLTSDVAHELRTPVANVSSQLEAMIEEVWEPTKERLQSCYDELGRISGIISDLEKLRQIEASNMVLEKEPVDLLELAQAVKTAFEPELAKKKLTCMVTGESAIISGDQRRLHQVIFNLVSNAVKYSTESGQILIDIHDAAIGHQRTAFQRAGAVRNVLHLTDQIGDHRVPHVLEGEHIGKQARQQYDEHRKRYMADQRLCTDAQRSIAENPVEHIPRP